MRMWWTSRGTVDPLVSVGDEAYRVTPLGNSRYLATRRSDANRVGIFDSQVPPLVLPDDGASRQTLAEVAAEATRLGYARR